MAIIATFEEDELSREYTDVATGGPIFDTGIVGNPKAIEQRTVNRYDPVREFDISFDGLREEQLLRLQEFFIMKAGRGIGFRFFPSVDNTFQNDLIGIGDGVTTVFYLRRNYRSRSRFYCRRIVKPVPYTVLITVDGEMVPYTDGTPLPVATGKSANLPTIVGLTVAIDWNTGVCTFSGGISSNRLIRVAQGEYDIPAYFETDAFSAADYETFQNWSSIKVREILPAALGAAGEYTSPLALAFTTPYSGETKNDKFDVTLTHTNVSRVILSVKDAPYAVDSSAPFAFTNVPNLSAPDERYTVTALGINGTNFVEASVELYSGFGYATYDPRDHASAKHTYDARAITGQSNNTNLAAWTDTKGVANLAQGTSGFQPKYLTNSGDPYVDFDGSDDSMVTGATFTALTDYSILAVFERDAIGESYGRLIGTSALLTTVIGTGDEMYLIPNAGGNDARVAIPHYPTKFMGALIERQGSTGRLWVDGKKDTDSAVDTTTGGTDLFLCSNGIGGENGAFRIKYLLFFNVGTLSTDPDFYKVFRFLYERYGARVASGIVNWKV